MSPRHETAPPSSQGDANGEMLTLDEIAAHYKVCTKTVRRLIKTLEIPVMLVGRQIRMPERYLPLFATKTWGKA